MLNILEDIKRQERIVRIGLRDSGQDNLFYSFNLNNHVLQSHAMRGIDRCEICASVSHRSTA